MTDIVERLRMAADVWRDNGRDQRHGAFLREAADEIERLRAALRDILEAWDAPPGGKRVMEMLLTRLRAEQEQR